MPLLSNDGDGIDDGKILDSDSNNDGDGRNVLARLQMVLPNRQHELVDCQHLLTVLRQIGVMFVDA